VSTTGTFLIRGARQLLTLRGPKEPRRGTALAELGIIHDGSLLIRDGVVEEVGTTRRVENLACARHAMEINAAGRVVMPGFVDCHTHACWAGGRLDEWEERLRGLPYAEILKKGGGTRATVLAVREAAPHVPVERFVRVVMTAINRRIFIWSLNGSSGPLPILGPSRAQMQARRRRQMIPSAPGQGS